MKRFLIAACLVASVTSAQAKVWVMTPKVVPIPSQGTSWVPGATATTSFLGVVAFLAGYDLWRRSFCVGDPLGLGGPGFSEPMPASGNIMIPKCMRR